MRFKIFIFQIIVLVAAQVGFANGNSSTFSPHGEMDCTLCHVANPILEVDTIETAPLMADFSCVNCHQPELGQENVSSNTCPPLPDSELTFCDLVGIGAEFDWETSTWCFTVNNSPPPYGTPIFLGLYVPCNSDGTSVCGKTCYNSDPGSGCGFGFSGAFSKCISQFCFLSGFSPPFAKGGYSLPFRRVPYKLHGYMIWDNECNDAMDYQYSCCTVEFGGLELVLTVPPEVQAGEPWQMIIEAQDTHGNVMTNYLGTVSFSVSQDKSFVFGPPKSGTDLPEYYHFEPDDSGRHVFDFVSYSEGPVDISVSDLWVDAQAIVTVLPGEPNCTKTQIYDPPPPVDPPDPINPLSSVVVKEPAPSRKVPNPDDEFRLLGGGGGYTVENICPQISVTPAYLPANGTDWAAISVTDITDSFGNVVINGSVTVEATVGTIMTPDEVPGPGTPGIQVMVTAGMTNFEVQAGTAGVQGDVIVSSLSGTVLAQDSLTVVKVEISDLQRVPVFGSDPQGSNEKSVTVNITPSPIPGGESVALACTTLSGFGSAVFDDNSNLKTISQSTTVIIRGVANSSAMDNIELSGRIGGVSFASDAFSVSTWPYEFRFHLLNTHLNFGLSVSMSWKSESGNLSDLSNVELREYVTYPHPGGNPPFTFHAIDPTIRPTTPMAGPSGGIGHYDFIQYDPAWVDFSTGVTDYMEANQDIQFHDTVLNSSWFNDILATFTITREVINDPSGTYWFRTTKIGTGGFSESCTENPW